MAVLWLGVLFLSVFVTPAASQDTVEITGRPVCEICRVSVEVIDVLESPDSVGLGRRDRHRVGLDGTGTLWVAPAAMPHAIVALASGSDEGPWISRRGQGPREFTSIRLIAVGPGDTLFALGDGKLNRYTRRGTFARTHRLMANPMNVLPSVDGAWILNGTIPTPQRAGYPLHRIDPEGTPRSSFGPVVGSRMGEPDLFEMRRALALRRAGGFWAARQNRYEIEHWGEDGSLVRTVRRTVPWFPAWTTPDPRAPFEVPPLPGLRSVAEDAEGRLWVLLYVASQDHQTGERPDLSDPSAWDAPMGRVHPQWDTLVEVLDPERGSVLTQHRFPGMLGDLLPGLHVVEPDLDDSGGQLLRLLRSSLSDG